MRTLMIGCLITALLGSATVVHADPLDPKILDLKSDVEKGKVMAATGTIAIAAGVATGIACGVVAGIGIAKSIDTPYVSSNPEEDKREGDELLAACALHPALLAIGIPLTAVGAHRAKKAAAQLKLEVDATRLTLRF